MFQVVERDHTTTVHSRFNFTKRNVEVVFQLSGVRNKTIYSFFKFQAVATAHVVTLPVTGTVGTFTPVFFHVITVYHQFAGRTFVETGKVTTHHDKVGSHSQCQHHMIILNNSTIRTDRHIHTCFAEILIAGLCHFNKCSSLSTSDSFLFAGDTDRTTTNTYFYKVGTSFGQVHKSVAIHNVSCSYFCFVAKRQLNIFECFLLVFRKTIRRVNTHNIYSGFHQSRYALFVVAGIDTCTYKQFHVVVRQFARVCFVIFVILTEHEVF